MRVHLHENKAGCTAASPPAGSESMGQNSEWVFNSICHNCSIASQWQETWRRENKKLQDQDLKWRGHWGWTLWRLPFSLLCGCLIDCGRFLLEPTWGSAAVILLSSSSQNRDLWLWVLTLKSLTCSSRMPQADVLVRAGVFTEKRENVKTKFKMSNNIQQVASTVWNLERDWNCRWGMLKFVQVKTPGCPAEFRWTMRSFFALDHDKKKKKPPRRWNIISK